MIRAFDEIIARQITAYANIISGYEERIERQCPPPDATHHEGKTALPLENIIGAFIVLLVGMMLAGVAATAEYCTSTRNGAAAYDRKEVQKRWMVDEKTEEKDKMEQAIDTLRTVQSQISSRGVQFIHVTVAHSAGTQHFVIR